MPDSKSRINSTPKIAISDLKKRPSFWEEHILGAPPKRNTLLGKQERALGNGGMASPGSALKPFPFSTCGDGGWVRRTRSFDWKIMRRRHEMFSPRGAMQRRVHRTKSFSCSASGFRLSAFRLSGKQMESQYQLARPFHSLSNHG